MKKTWDATLYDSKHGFVSQYGESLIEVLDPQNGEMILDMGCGTGDLTSKIAEKGAQVEGVDSAESMIAEAQKKFPHIHFSVMDIRDLHFEKQFDAVFSNAVLHWIKESEKAIVSIHSVLKPGGRFVAEFGGKDNIQHIKHAIFTVRKNHGMGSSEDLSPWYYPSVGEYSSLLEKHGFIMRVVWYFDRPTKLEGPDGIKNWITMFVKQNFFKNISDEKYDLLMKECQDLLRPILMKDGVWYADYKRLRFVAEKR